MKSRYILLVFILMIIGSPELRADEFDSLRLERRPEGHFVIHRVEAGETLYSLSRRYASNLVKIAEANKLEGYSIDVGQIVAIPYEFKEKTNSVTEADRTTHTVKPKETLYAISHIYGVNIYDIKEWNDLESNDLEVGQVLIVSGKSGLQSDNQQVQQGKPVTDDLPESPVENIRDPEYGRSHIVKKGETLYSISKKYAISQDKLKKMNNLSDNNLSIGQSLVLSKKLVDPAAYEPEIKPESQESEDTVNDSRSGEIVREEVNVDATIDSTEIRKPVLTTTDTENQFEKVFEEGIGMEIENSPKTRKYLCLHRSLPIGTIIQVKNLMNSQSIFVRVVGKLPDIGANENVLIRLSSVAYKRLGAIDARFPVEISYIPE